MSRISAVQERTSPKKEEGPAWTMHRILRKPKARGQRSAVDLARVLSTGTPVCGDQLALINEVLPLIEEHSAQVLDISVDGIWSHRAFVENGNLRFPIASDFEPKGAVAMAYGVCDAEKDTSQRALFIVEAAGLVRWNCVSPSNVNPGVDGILKALESLDA